VGVIAGLLYGANRQALHSFAKVLLMCWAATVVRPACAGNPYSSILQRNVFGLRPPPPVVNEPAHGPLPKVRLTGITTILKGKRALLKVEFPAKPRERPKEESLILEEGQRAGSIEVLQIDEKIAQVKLNNSGTITNITFEKIAAAPAPGPQPPGAVPKWRGLPYRPLHR
jgi:hypothetical protein